MTGSSLSEIDGILRANADVFLLNPNGILFGPNAFLEIDGSLMVSTATGIRFASGDLYSTVDPAS